MKILKFLFLIATGLIPLKSNAELGDREVYAELRSKLAAAKTTSDSVTNLYDLFDVAIGSEKKKAGWALLDLAVQHDDQNVLADLIPQMAYLEMKNEENMKKLTNYAQLLKDSTQLKTVNLFLDVTKSNYYLIYNTDVDRHDVIVKYAQHDFSTSDNLYDNIGDLYRMVTFLGQTTYGNIYLEYLTQLEKMIEQLPENSRQLRSLFYTTSANVHTRNGNHKKALEADRRLLKLIDTLAEKARKEGRSYRDYSRNYYICYRRMLRNYPGMSPEEINDIYAKCLELAEVNPEVKADIYDKCYITSYKLMSEQKYAEAIPYIKKSLAHALDDSNKNQLIGMLVMAATATNDNATLIPALKDFIKILQDKLIQNNESAYHELQIRFDVNKLKEENVALELDKRDAMIMGRQRVITAALASLLIMAVILMLLYRSHFRLRHRVEDLRVENNRLHQHLKELLSDGTPDGTISMEDYDHAKDDKSL